MIPEAPNNEPQWRDALRKILLLEEHKGFADTAVSGGIRRFVDLWESELREYLADQPELVGGLIERQYRDLSGEQRRAWVEAWRRVISQVRDVPPGPTGVEVNAVLSQPENADASRTDRWLIAPSEPLKPSGRKSSYGAPAPNANPGDANEAVSTLRRMDGKTVQRLELLDVHSVRDLLYMLPRRHDDRSEISNISDVYPGENFTLEGTLVDIGSARGRAEAIAAGSGCLAGRYGGDRTAMVWAGIFGPIATSGEPIIGMGKSRNIPRSLGDVIARI